MQTNYATLRALMNARIKVLGPTVVYGREIAGYVRSANPDNRIFTLVDDEGGEYPAGFGVTLLLADEGEAPRLAEELAAGP